MTTTEEPQENAVAKTVDKAQYLVCVVLVAVGAFLIYDALTLEAGFAKVDPGRARGCSRSSSASFSIVLAVILADRDPARIGR